MWLTPVWLRFSVDKSCNFIDNTSTTFFLLLLTLFLLALTYLLSCSVVSEGFRVCCFQLCEMPWRQIFRSGPVWGIIIANFCVDWGLYTYLTNIPTFFYEVLFFDIKSVTVKRFYVTVLLFLLFNPHCSSASCKHCSSVAANSRSDSCNK